MYNPKLKGGGKSIMGKRIWTEEKLNELREYCDFGEGVGYKVAEISRRMGIPKNQIRNAMCNYKIKNGRRGCAIGPGKIPWNKGRRTGAGRHAGSFPKGYKPHHYVEENTVSKHKRKNGFVWRIKIDGKWEQYLPYLYEKKHGHPVPKGYVLRLKEGVTHQPTLDDALLITRAENSKMNLNPEKSAKTLKERNKQKARYFDPRADIPWYLQESKIIKQKQA